jgi:protein O-GlcNAc transferase
VTIHDAHQRLEHALAKAKSTPPNLLAEHGKIESRNWIGLTQLAETVLSSVPHDPVALSCLAEVEFAHGHTDFAVTYLRYAADAMAKQAQIAKCRAGCELTSR